MSAVFTQPEAWTFRDRSGWPKGPWDNERSDKIQWIDGATDLDCLLHRNHMGAWCGYVGVPPGHPLHQRSYEHVNGLTVHGGLTYSDFCDPAGAEGGSGVCHIARPGRPEAVWWLGFDCGHSYDLIPAFAEMDFGGGAVLQYRTSGYAAKECVDLAAQLALVGKGGAA